MANSKIPDLTGLTTLAADDVIYVVDVSDTTDSTDGTSKKYAVGITSAIVGLTDSQTLTNKTLTSPVLTTPQINDTSADHQYVFAVSELAADRTVTLPLLTGADTFVFNDFTATLTNKTLTTPVIASFYQDAGKTKLMTTPNTASDTLAALDATQTFTNKTLTSPKVGTAIADTSGNELIKVTATASAINEITLANGAAGGSPVLSMTGGDDNVGLDIKMKGTGKMRKPTIVGLSVFESGDNTATGDAKTFFRVPAEMNGMNLTGVSACVYTAGTTGTLDVQIRNHTDTQDMLSTKITIDSTETDTATALTAAVIDATKDDVVTGDVIAVDVDAVHTTPAKGLYVELRFELP